MHPHDTKLKLASGAYPADPRAFGLIKAAYSVSETLELLSIGRTSLYEAVKRGELRLVKFGKKTLVYATDIAAFLSRLQDTG
jgi:excisionase family DNA binding protein